MNSLLVTLLVVLRVSLYIWLLSHIEYMSRLIDALYSFFLKIQVYFHIKKLLLDVSHRRSFSYSFDEFINLF